VSVRKVYCGKMADWIWIPFGVVSGVGRGMGVLDGVVIVEWEGAVFGVNVEHPIVTNGDGDALFPNYFGEDLSSLSLYGPQKRKYTTYCIVIRAGLIHGQR